MQKLIGVLTNKLQKLWKQTEENVGVEKNVSQI